MAVTINKTDGTVLTTIQDGAIDTTNTNLVLIGRLYRNYGELVNENFVKLLENFANSSSPTTPIVGQLWYNTSTGVMNVYRSTGFVSLAVLTTSAAQPNLPKLGDLWYDTSDEQLKIYNGSAWSIISPMYSSSQSKTGVFVESRRDVANNNHICIVHYQQNSIVAIHCRDNEWTPQSSISGFISIKPGFNLASVNSQQFVGTVTNAASLGNIAANSYLRNDVSGTVDGNLTINELLFVGETNNLQLSIVGNNAFISKAEGNINLVSGSNTVLTINETIQAQFANGSAATPSITFINDTDSGLFRINNNVIGVGVGGSTILEVSGGGLTINGSVQANNFSGTLNATSIITSNLQVTENTILGSTASNNVQILAGNIIIPNGLIFSTANVTFTGQVKFDDLLSSADGVSPIIIDSNLEILESLSVDANITVDGGFNFANLFVSTENGTVLVNTNQEATGYYNQGDITLGNNVVVGVIKNNAIFARNIPKHLGVFNGIFGEVAMYNGHHVSTVTRASTGVYVLTLQDDSNIDIPLISLYPEVLVTVNGAGHGSYDVITTPSQTSITIRTFNTSGSAADFSRISVAIWDGETF